MTIDEVKRTAQQQMNKALKDHARLSSLSCSIMCVSQWARNCSITHLHVLIGSF